MMRRSFVSLCPPMLQTIANSALYEQEVVAYFGQNSSWMRFPTEKALENYCTTTRGTLSLGQSPLVVKRVAASVITKSKDQDLKVSNPKIVKPENTPHAMELELKTGDFKPDLLLCSTQDDANATHSAIKEALATAGSHAAWVEKGVVPQFTEIGPKFLNDATSVLNGPNRIKTICGEITVNPQQVPSKLFQLEKSLAMLERMNTKNAEFSIPDANGQPQVVTAVEPWGTPRLAIVFFNVDMGRAKQGLSLMNNIMNELRTRTPNVHLLDKDTHVLAVFAPFRNLFAAVNNIKVELKKTATKDDLENAVGSLVTTEALGKAMESLKRDILAAINVKN